MLEGITGTDRQDQEIEDSGESTELTPLGEEQYDSGLVDELVGDGDKEP